jgi:dephospho-CoA kinase
MSWSVGLTGGIGCGKSRAAALFEALGADIIDTDVLSRELTRPAGAAMAAISKQFGDAYIAPDGGLDRTRMRQLVFSDPEAKRKLEAILHPLIRKGALARLAASRAPYAVLVVPLLLETGSYRELVKRVVVVDCDETQQIARTMPRSGLTEDEVRAIMSHQMARAERLARADDVIVNDGGIDELRVRVAALHEQFLEAAKNA